MADDDGALPDFPDETGDDADIPTAPADPDDPRGEAEDLDQPLNPA